MCSYRIRHSEKTHHRHREHHLLEMKDALKIKECYLLGVIQHTKTFSLPQDTFGGLAAHASTPSHRSHPLRKPMN